MSCPAIDVLEGRVVRLHQGRREAVHDRRWRSGRAGPPVSRRGRAAPAPRRPRRSIQRHADPRARGACRFGGRAPAPGRGWLSNRERDRGRDRGGRRPRHGRDCRPLPRVPHRGRDPVRRPARRGDRRPGRRGCRRRLDEELGHDGCDPRAGLRGGRGQTAARDEHGARWIARGARRRPPRRGPARRAPRDRGGRHLVDRRPGRGPRARVRGRGGGQRAARRAASRCREAHRRSRAEPARLGPAPRLTRQRAGFCARTHRNATSPSAPSSSRPRRAPARGLPLRGAPGSCRRRSC